MGVDEDFITHMRSTHDYRVSEKQFKEEFNMITKMANHNRVSQLTPATLANSRSHVFLNQPFYGQTNSSNDVAPISRSVSTSNSSIDLQNLSRE